jgi:glycine dehydrogenase
MITLNSIKRLKSKAFVRMAFLERQNSNTNKLTKYHIPFSEEEKLYMLQTLKFNKMDSLIKKVIPKDLLNIKKVKTPAEDMDIILKNFYKMISTNNPSSCFIGQGFYPTNIPPVIKRCILQNPKWYTAYTPYQAEISQGRLETIFNYQILIKRLTGMDVANASLLDEASAAAEAMLMAWRVLGGRKNTFLVLKSVYSSTISVVLSTARDLNIKIVEIDEVTQDIINTHGGDLIGLLGQTPDKFGFLHDYGKSIELVQKAGGLAIIGTDLLSCVMMKPPGESGSDIVYGNGQRFGNSMGFGGPNAAFFAVKNQYIRHMPGRLITVTNDRHGNVAYRMSLQTREQHIRREKATSNICTAQVLLANLNFFYALYHGEDGLKKIAARVHKNACILATMFENNGYKVLRHSNNSLSQTQGQKTFDFFDTVTVKVSDAQYHLQKLQKFGISAYLMDQNHLTVSIDETKTEKDIKNFVKYFCETPANLKISEAEIGLSDESKMRQSPIFHERDIFNHMKGENELMRYISRMETKDVTLCNSMIPLGSCTMKLNSAFEMEPLTNEKFDVHPFANPSESKGYMAMIRDLSKHLCYITDMAAVTYESNSGATGEYVGLKAIKRYHESRKDDHRNVVLIPSSAHGTNPASAAKIGLKIVVVKADDLGYVDLKDFHEKVEEHKENLFGMMMTYPSTHGVFEEDTRYILETIHNAGGQVYIDGANMNAQMGLSSPGFIGGDVCHLNLHKTFCIPHGGGGPGMGPVLVKEHLSGFLPGHVEMNDNVFLADGTIIKGNPDVKIVYAPLGSASILSISYLYIIGMGYNGLRDSSSQAILSANYLAKILSEHYPILYTNKNKRVAHEFIIDIRDIKKVSGISEEDIAKRLMDFGFHAPTMSFPVAGTLMIEPTESENIDELNRLAEAFIKIKEEINLVIAKKYDPIDNPLKNAPHTLQELLKDSWSHAYSREEAAYPLSWIRTRGKIWPSVGRIDNIQGDRTLKTDY